MMGRAMDVLQYPCGVSLANRYSAEPHNETPLCAQAPVRWRGFAQDGRRSAQVLALPRARRQRALQWRTSSQTFAHFLRHAIERPQVAQVLTGRSDLRRARGIYRSRLSCALPRPGLRRGRLRLACFPTMRAVSASPRCAARRAYTAAFAARAAATGSTTGAGYALPSTPPAPSQSQGRCRYASGTAASSGTQSRVNAP